MIPFSFSICCRRSASAVLGLSDQRIQRCVPVELLIVQKAK